MNQKNVEKQMAKKIGAWISALLFILLVTGITFFLFTQQTFLPSNTRYLMSLKFSASTDVPSQSFFFDDYELRATAQNGYQDAPVGCTPLGSSPCGGCSDLASDSYGCPRRTCNIPKTCNLQCGYRCKWTNYWREWQSCGQFKCYGWGSETIAGSRIGGRQGRMITNCDNCGTVAEESGGMQLKTVKAGCMSKYELFYKGSKVHDFVGILGDGFSKDTNQVKLRDGVVNPESVPNIQDTLKGQHDFDLYWGEKETNNLGDCLSVGGVLTLSPPPDAISARVKDVPDFLIAGQYANVSLVITNTWRPASGTLFIDYIVPTLIGNATKTDSYQITLPVGNTLFAVSIPTTQVTDTVLIRPRFDLNVDISQWTNVLLFDRSGEPGVVSIGGEIEENWTAVQIVPKPLYIAKPANGCYGDYVDSKSAPGYCMLSTIKELTCYQIGCPKIDIGGKEITSYECTSSGICAQTVFVEKKCTTDASCGRTDLKCDVGSGLCIQEKIFENILQCKESTDCPNPCNGKKASCTNNKCTYAGECEITKLPAEVIERIVERTLPGETRIQYEFIKEEAKQQETIPPTGNAGLLLALVILFIVLVVGVIIAKGLKRKK